MDLKDRLVDLADEVRDVQPPSGLWDLEVRRRALARRHTVVVVLVAALVVVGLLVGDWHAARQPAPADPGGETFMPDRVWRPSPWLPGTGGAGDLGQLIAITIADRGGWFGSESGVAGVSAVTGEYRFLDLPDVADPSAAQPALAPDGRHVAYWTVGAPEGTPPERGKPAVVGLAVYDVVTGAVQRAPIATLHGIEPKALFFADARTLVASYDQWMAGYDGPAEQQGSFSSAPDLVWRFLDGTPSVLAVGSGSFFDGVPAARDGRVWTAASTQRNTTSLVDLRHGVDMRWLRGVQVQGISYTFSSEGALSSDGRQLAVVGGQTLPDKSPNRVWAYDLSPGPDCCVGSIIPGSARSWNAVAWLDEGHVLLLKSLRPERTQTHHALVAVDIRNGDNRTVTTFPVGVLDWAWAVDLVNSPSTPGVQPPRPWDPRVTTGLVVVVLAGAALVIGVRRRRRGRA